MKEKLSQLLSSKGIRSSQLAQMTELSTSTVDDILKGKVNELNIGIGKMLRIAAALNVSVEYLYDRDEPTESNHSLDADEISLIQNFEQLNDEGKEKVLSYVEDIVDTGKYKKHNSSGMDQEAVAF